MPIYEYKCLSCDTQSEVMQRISEPPLETCEDCGGELKKLISAPAFQFKGSGWYVTDYAGKGGDNGKEGKDKGSKSSESKTKESKSDSSGSSSSDSSSSSSSGSSSKSKSAE
ncbi:MAG: zinc ribbon domain-containing protein [bacterium]|nr:zinc ribbon domain-containing protein [bacterium]